MLKAFIPSQQAHEVRFVGRACLIYLSPYFFISLFILDSSQTSFLPFRVDWVCRSWKHDSVQVSRLRNGVRIPKPIRPRPQRYWRYSTLLYWPIDNTKGIPLSLMNVYKTSTQLNLFRYNPFWVKVGEQLPESFNSTARNRTFVQGEHKGWPPCDDSYLFIAPHKGALFRD